jgi:hypothetical protein
MTSTTTFASIAARRTYDNLLTTYKEARAGMLSAIAAKDAQNRATTATEAIPTNAPKYLGALDADPTTGMHTNDWYFRKNTTPKKIRRYNGTAWGDVSSSDAQYAQYIGAALNDMTALALASGDDGFVFFTNLVARNIFSQIITILSGGQIKSSDNHLMITNSVSGELDGLVLSTGDLTNKQNGDKYLLVTQMDDFGTKYALLEFAERISGTDTVLGAFYYQYAASPSTSNGVILEARSGEDIILANIGFGSTPYTVRPGADGVCDLGRINFGTDNAVNRRFRNAFLSGYIDCYKITNTAGGIGTAKTTTGNAITFTIKKSGVFCLLTGAAGELVYLKIKYAGSYCSYKQSTAATNYFIELQPGEYELSKSENAVSATLECIGAINTANGSDIWT